MKKLLVIFLTVFSILVNYVTAIGQINVSIPDTSENFGEIIEIPVNIGDVTGSNIYSFDIWITFNENVLVMNTLLAGNISDSLRVISNILPGEIKISAYQVYDPLSGQGTLFKLQFKVVGNIGDQTQLHFKRCLLNADPVENPQDGTFTVNTYDVNVTITTNIGNGTNVIVDGTNYDAPYQTTWLAGVSHTIGVASPQNEQDGTRNVFSSWSDGGDQTHSVKIYEEATLTANLKTQYKVTIVSDYGNPVGAGWYDEGEQVQFSVDSPVAGDTGIQYVFESWGGVGNVSYSGISNPATITVNEPITETINWTTQYYLTVSSPRGNPQGEGWYNAGESAQFSVDSDVTVEKEAKYQFASWTGAGNGSCSGGNNSASVIMSNPIQETANWLATHYFLSTLVNPENGGSINTAPPGQWVEVGNSVDVSEPQIKLIFL